MNLFRATLPDLQCSIRILHALPKTGPIDAYANGEPIAKGLSFGKYSPYLQLDSGSYEIQLYPAGLYDKPILTQTIDLVPRSASTISVVTLDDTISLFILNDSNSGHNIANSFVRFINLSPNSPLLTLALSNASPIFTNVEYVETTGYYPLSPGIYNFRVTLATTESISKFISELRLVNGHFYTIYIIGLFNDTPQLGYLVLSDGR